MSEYVSDPLPEPDPVAIEVAEEPAPVEEAVETTTQEVVQNVQEILTTETVEPVIQEVSTEVVDNSNQNELEEKVKVLEERLEEFIGYFKNVEQLVSIDVNGSLRQIISNICN